MSYKTQHTILVIFLLFFLYKFSVYSFTWPIDKTEFVAESVMLFACFALMYYIAPLKTVPKVYWLMLLGSAFYSVSAFMDLFEEFFIESNIRESNLDDYLKTVGFILMSLGIYRWMGLHKNLISELKVKAETDLLTGLLNRRAFIQRLTGKDKPKDGKGRALLLLDIDHFKAINDNYGHTCGDMVLSSTASALKSLIRENDILARWGGEEFLFYLANVTEDESIYIAEKLRKHIESLVFNCNNHEIRCTFSIGVYHAQTSKCLEEEVDFADKALYQAKTAGRNCVILYKKRNEPI